MSNKVWFFSHSRAESDSYCKRKRYLSSEWGGTGLEPTQGGWDLQFGNIIHAHLNILAGDGKIYPDQLRAEVYTEAIKVLNEPQAKDYATLAEGLLRGFVKSIWPLWMKDFDVIETEQMRQWEVEPSHVFRFKQDLLLRHKLSESLVYPDYKTTSSDSPQWIASHTKSPQLHSSMYALKQGYNLNIDHAFIQGLYKGYKDKKTGHISSIFSRGWVNREFQMHPEYSYKYKAYKGWEPFYTYDEFPMGLGEWVHNMPPEILAEQFPRTAPIYPRDEIAETYFRQQMIREREVAYALEKLTSATDNESVESNMDAHFPQDFHKCTPAFGFDCEFKNLCWTPWIEGDPLGSGQFVRRDQTYESGLVVKE